MGSEKNRVTPKFKKFARQLLKDEAAAGKYIGNSPAAFRTCEKLRLPLSKMMGSAGFRLLMSRALALAVVEVSWLREVQIKADGSLEGLQELEEKLSHDEIERGETVLVGRFLELLATFIGAALMSELIQDVWPDGDFDDLNFGKGKRP